MAFAYRDGVLCAEQVSLEDIARALRHALLRLFARRDRARTTREFARALAGRRVAGCYSVKANSNLAVLRAAGAARRGLRHRLGRRAGARARRGRRPAQGACSPASARARPRSRQALAAGILCLNLESEGELERVEPQSRRDLGVRAPVAFRVNPDVDAKTHPYISTGLKQNKFGIAYADAERLYREAARLPNLEVVGIGCHIGSLMTDSRAVRRLRPQRIVALARAPGAGRHRVCRTSTSAAASASATATSRRRRSPRSSTARSACSRARKETADRRSGPLDRRQRGRAADARASTSSPAPRRTSLVVDAAMNDLIRPALYDAWHEVRAVREAEPGAQPGCLRRRRPGLRERRFPRPGPDAWRRAPATCSP